MRAIVYVVSSPYTQASKDPAPHRRTGMASAGPKQSSNQNPTLAQRLLAVGEPRFTVFEKQRHAGVPPPPNPKLPPGSIDIPEDTPAVELLRESAAAATWFAEHVKDEEDIMFSRIPGWAVERVTTFMFPKVLVESWPPIEYGPIDKAEASCLQVKDIRGKGKGCVAAHAVPRGEPVARERALLVMPRTCGSLRSFVGTATYRMTPNQQEAFFALHNCHSSDKGDALGIISSNSFLIPGVPGHDVLYSAVFETFSRINHRYDISPRSMVSQVLTNQVSPAVAQMRCLNGTMLHSPEKSEHCGRYREGKR